MYPVNSDFRDLHYLHLRIAKIMSVGRHAYFSYKNINIKFISILLLVILHLLDSHTDQYMQDKKEKKSDSKLLISLEKFMLQLSEIMNRDCSTDMPFVARMSKAWIDIVSEKKLLEKNHVDCKYLLPLNTLVKKAEKYPPRADHGLSYYLLHHDGGKWTPIPFMQILKRLHVNYFRLKSESTLFKFHEFVNSLILGIKSST